MRWALLVVAILLVAGCATRSGSFPGEATTLPYPRIGDVATYSVSGAYVELARWENGHPVDAGTQLSFAVTAGPKVLDGARQVLDSYRVTTTLHGAKFADLYVSPAYGHTLVQAVYPLSQDQNVVAFDERGYPWLFGASALFGRTVAPGSSAGFALPNGLVAQPPVVATAAWVFVGSEPDGLRFDLKDLPGYAGSVWLKPGSAWPARVHLAATGNDLAPWLRLDGPAPATMDARLVSLAPGSQFLPPRDSSKQYGADGSVKRVAWSGEAPPDGDQPATPYALADAMRDAKLLDKGLQGYLASAQDPRLYRATFKMVPLNDTGPLADAMEPYWLLEWMEKGGRYYLVEMQRVDAPSSPTGPPPTAPLPTALPAQGVPRVLSSGPADAPADTAHGWFPKEAEPDQLVPLSEAVRVVRSTFGAQGIQIYLRSFAQPPGYAYFIDGGWDQGEPHRYTVVYEPGAGFIQEATGPVGARLAS